MLLKRIRLELDGTPEFPDGHPGCGYEFTAPLDRGNKLDTRGWTQERKHCGVRRFWHSTTDEHGSLVHHRGNRWAFAWPGGAGSEEPIAQLDRAAFSVGACIAVTEHDGVSRAFRVVSVETVH